MNILAMDTATSAMTVTISNEQHLLAGSVVATERNHSIRLAPEIAQLLEGLNLSRKSLGGIVCGVGPGSYTGVRIGVTVAKTMAWALGIPVWPLSSMHILAWSGWLKAQNERHSDQSDQRAPVWIVPMADARRGQAFTGLYEVNVSTDSIRLISLDEDRVAPAKEWLESIDTRAQQAGVTRLIVTGELSAFQVLRESDQRFVWIDAQASEEGIDQAVRDALAETIGLQSYDPDKNQTGLLPVTVHDLLPNYTQLAEAESKWLAGRASVQADSVSAAKDV